MFLASAQESQAPSSNAARKQRTKSRTRTHWSELRRGSDREEILAQVQHKRSPTALTLMAKVVWFGLRIETRLIGIIFVTLSGVLERSSSQTIVTVKLQTTIQSAGFHLAGSLWVAIQQLALITKTTPLGHSAKPLSSLMW